MVIQSKGRTILLFQLYNLTVLSLLKMSRNYSALFSVDSIEKKSNEKNKKMTCFCEREKFVWKHYTVQRSLIYSQRCFKLFCEHQW